MYWTYLRRELVGRKKQTIIVAAGLAIAIALVIVVNSLAAGVRDAQAQALESVYGVGTDLTVTGAQAEPGAGGGRASSSSESDGQTTGRHHEPQPVAAHDRSDARHTRRLDRRRPSPASTAWRRHPARLHSPTRPSRGSCPSRSRPRMPAPRPTQARGTPQDGDTGRCGGGFGGGNFDVTPSGARHRSCRRPPSARCRRSR